MRKINLINVAAILTMLFLLAGICSASKNDAAVHANVHNQRKMLFEKIFNINGEPSFAMIQDKDGFIWSGSTSSGLVEFNRKTETFIIHKNDPNDEDSLPENSNFTNRIEWIRKACLIISLCPA